MACSRELLCLTFAGFCLWPAALLAELLPEPAGHVARVVGEAFVTSRGVTSAALPGQALVEGMILQTGARGGLAVMFEDGTVMSFGPDSEMQLARYRFVPTSETFALEARFERGTLSVLSGSIARFAPDAIRLETPEGSVRVHAGHALLKVVR